MPRKKIQNSAQALNLDLVGKNLNQPLHVKVRQMLRERVLHDFDHNQRFHSERKLIDTLGVSQPTIRRALSDLVSEGFLLADARRGYFVRHQAEVRYVGLIQSVWEHQPYGNLFSEYYMACRATDNVLVPYGLHQSDTADSIMKMLLHLPSEERIIITGQTLEMTLELGMHLQTSGYRHMLLGPAPTGFTGSSISRNSENDVELILNYLLELGHRRIVFMINEPDTLVLTNRRAAVIRRMLAERNLTEATLVNCKTQNWQNSFDAAYKKTGEILESKPWPTAIVPLSGAGSWAVLRYAIERGIKVPEQFSVLSFDSTVNSDILPIPLTELILSESEFAREAVKILWGKSLAPVHAKLESKLVVRSSSGPARS